MNIHKISKAIAAVHIVNTPDDILHKAAENVGISYEEAYDMIAGSWIPGESDPIEYNDVVRTLRDIMEGPI